jgi:hypothetical protein
VRTVVIEEGKYKKETENKHTADKKKQTVENIMKQNRIQI